MTEIDYPENVAEPEGSELVTVPSHHLRDFMNELVEDLLGSDKLIIYVGVTKQSSKLKSIFQEKGLDTNRILFFDLATKIAGSAPDRAKNTVFMKPENINQLNMKLDDAANSVPDSRESVIVFDTVSTLSIYTDQELVLKFLNSLVAKSDDWGIKTVLVGIEEEMNEKLSSAVEKSVSQNFAIQDD